jgi:PKD repeat protein
MWILFLFLIVIIGFVSATFEIGDLSYSIDKQYAPNDYIKGWINISLDNEPANSVFNDSQGNSISLIALLEENNDFDYDCSPINCASDYSAESPELTKTFDSVESNFFGFKLTGNNIVINSISFTLESDVPASCYNQLKVDIFNNGVIDIRNNKSLDLYCFSKPDYGCFNDSKQSSEGLITSTPYCQRIKLSKSPGFKFGAWVKHISGSEDLMMELYDLNGDWIDGCDLLGATAEGGEISCDIEYLVTESEDYYVCISNSGDGTSYIKGYSDPENPCAFKGNPVKEEIAAYDIFAQAKQFSSIGTLEITNSLPNGESFNTKANNYISSVYGDDCPSGCVIPIKFIPREFQEITIKDLLIEYDKSALSGQVERNFYELTETPAVMNADFQKLYLDNANFSVPDEYGDFTFELNFNDQEIFSEELVVESVPIIIESLIPTITASAFPTLFEVTIESSEDIIKYEWDFGDGNSKITTTNKTTHTYDFIGSYELELIVTDSNRRNSSKIFNIVVSTPEEAINNILRKMQEDLINITAQIGDFDSFSQESLNSILDIESLNEEFKNIQSANASANSEGAYNEIMGRLLDLKIPEKVFISRSTPLILFFPDKNNINLDVLKAIGGGNYNASSEDNYIDAIYAWNQQNIETKIILKSFSVIYENSKEPILKTFELKVDKKTDLYPYLIFHELDNLKFKEDYKEKEESGYVYITLTESEETIVFSTTEDIDFLELPVFISPKISKLTIHFDEKEKEQKWMLFILIIFLLVLFGFIAYIILQVWYQKRYESYLFKNKNDLYNLISYIQNAKRKGLKDKEINAKLRKSGWDSERIRYVMRKYSGKKTGMFEIFPVRKILSKFGERTENSMKMKKFRAGQQNPRKPLRRF